ncbi:hypothetical protein QE152_g26953 [Popillia japonica]|uniref:Uncharacterized protein n=1 Tax=Popillia japonica TaxID=7064 RepID=A0AAW1JWX5_POPJA
MIKDGSGKILRRNRIDIRQSLNECQNNCKKLYLSNDSGTSDNIDNDHVTSVDLSNDSGTSDNIDNDHVTSVEHSTESTNKCATNVPITLNSVFEPDQGVWLKNLIV